MHEETNLVALSHQKQFELITESNIKINGLSNINESLSVHYLIYRIDNLENGHYYIGQHKTKNPLDKYMGSGLLINNAIAKHGIEKFVKTILFDFDNFEEMNEKEKELVPLSACYPTNPFSYNLKGGGSNGELSEETKEKLSKSHIGRKLSLEHRQHMCKPRTIEHRQHMCQPRTAEHRQHISDGLLKRTDEQKRITSSKISLAWHDKSEEQKRAIIKKSHDAGWTLKTKEEKDQIRLKHSQAWNNKSEEQKKEILKKRSQTYKHMNKQQLEQISKNKSLAWKRKPLEERLERNKKISSFYKNASKDYKEQRNQKISVGVSKLKWYTDILTGKHYRLKDSSNPNFIKGRLTKEQIAKLVDLLKKPIEEQVEKSNK